MSRLFARDSQTLGHPLHSRAGNTTIVVIASS
jgi:hypothetical protein